MSGKHDQHNLENGVFMHSRLLIQTAYEMQQWKWCIAGDLFMFQQDSTPAHHVRETVPPVGMPEFIPLDLWPPNTTKYGGRCKSVCTRHCQRHQPVEAASHWNVVYRITKYHRQCYWSMENATISMQEGQGTSLWTLAILSQFFSDLTTKIRRSFNCCQSRFLIKQDNRNGHIMLNMDIIFGKCSELYSKIELILSRLLQDWHWETVYYLSSIMIIVRFWHFFVPWCDNIIAHQRQRQTDSTNIQALCYFASTSIPKNNK